MEIIVPAAGLSTRFAGERPKYLWYTYDNELMLKKAVQPYIDIGLRITVGVLREHEKKFDASEHILNAIPKCSVTYIDGPTKGPADTVYQIIKKTGIFPIKGPFLVKDCDSFFDPLPFTGGNHICVSNIKEHETLNKLASKSFVKYNDQGTVLDIVEKEIVSDTFCVGGYKFASPEEYCKSYEYVSSYFSGEIYVSHIIRSMMSDGKTFNIRPVKNYVDVGTQADWMKYNNKPTIFFDIDGCLIEAQSRFGNNSYSSPPKVLTNNYELLMKHYNNGSQVIFVTAREPKYEEVTRTMLESLGFRDCLLIMGVNNTARVLVNDYNEANPYPRAVAHNIKRNHDNLKDIME